MTLKERIKELCKKNNISMNQLEKELGFGVGYISKLGNTTPNTKKIQLIADYFKVSVDYLMTGKELEFSVEMAQKDLALSNMSERLKEYALKLSEMSEDKQELVLQLIDKLEE